MGHEVALVTGGTGDIGTAICKALSKNNIQVIAASLESDVTAEYWLKQVHDPNIHFKFLDVTNFEACSKLVAEVEQEFKHIDILINAAGICRDIRFHSMDLEDWDKVIQVDLNSMFYVSRHVVPGMMARGYGRIVNISSINGLKGQFGQVNYSAAKAGIYGFTKALAQEMGRKGITVNAVSPGYIDSNMVMGVPEAIREKLRGESAVGRLGRPEEVGRLVAFLAEKESGFITGANYIIDGGLYMY